MQSLRSLDPELLSYPQTRTDRSLRPRFCLRRRGGELYFVNHSDETLDWVANASVGGFDDDGAAVVTADTQRRYEQVLPGEAVLIDEFDEYFDTGMYIASSVTMSSPSLGTIGFQAVGKGGPGSMVLLWLDGFVSPHVHVTRETPPDIAT